MLIGEVHSLLVNLNESYPKQGRPWGQTWQKAREGPVKGAWILFPTGHYSEALLRDFARRKLAVHPIDWLTLGEPFWTVDVSKLQQDFAAWKFYGEVPAWPSWLEGTIEMSPVFEQPPGGKARLSLWITQEAYSTAERRERERRERSSMTSMHFYGGVVMTSQQSTTLTNSQLSFGDNSQVQVGNANVSEGNTLAQHSDPSAGLDLALLASELKQIRAALFSEMANLDEFVASKGQAALSIAEAEGAAKRGEGSDAMKHLKAAGKWALETATKIGTTVAAEAIKKAMNL